MFMSSIYFSSLLISVRSVVNMNSKLLSGDDADRHVRQTGRGNTGGREGRSGSGSCERTFGVAMGQFAMRSSSQPARAEGGVCFVLNEAYERASVATN